MVPQFRKRVALSMVLLACAIIMVEKGDNHPGSLAFYSLIAGGFMFVAAGLTISILHELRRR